MVLGLTHKYCFVGRVLWLFYLLTGVAFGGQGQLYQLQQCPEKEQIPVLWATDLQNDTVQMVRQLDSIRAWARQRHDTKLYEYTFIRQMVTQAGGENNRGASISRQEAVFLQMAPFFATCTSAEVKAVYALQLGRFYFYHNDFEKAFHYIVPAIDQFEEIGFENLSLRDDIPRDLFGFFYKFGDYYTAEQYCKLAVRYNDERIFRKPFDMNNLGETYVQLKDYRNAKQTFLETMRYSQAHNDSVYWGLASGNYGNVLQIEGRYREAIPYLYTDIVYNSTAVPESAARNAVHLAWCLLQLDSVQKAKHYLDLALHLQPNRMLLETWYETLALYEQKTGNYRLAALHLDTLLRVRDSLKSLYNGRLLMAARLEGKEKKMLSQRKQAAEDARHLLFVRNLIIAGLLVVFSLVVALLDQRRHREKKERLLRQEKQLRAEEMLNRANEKLEQYLQTVREKSQLLEALEAQVEALQKGQERPALSEQLQKLRSAVILTGEDWKTFKKLFDQGWPGYLDNMRLQYPGLTEGDQRLLALSKLQLSGKEMAAMLGISLESLRKNRYRLHKKYSSLSLDDNPGDSPSASTQY